MICLSLATSRQTWGQMDSVGRVVHEHCNCSGLAWLGCLIGFRRQWYSMILCDVIISCSGRSLSDLNRTMTTADRAYIAKRFQQRQKNRKVKKDAWPDGVLSRCTAAVSQCIWLTTINWMHCTAFVYICMHLYAFVFDSWCLDCFCFFRDQPFCRVIAGINSKRIGTTWSNHSVEEPARRCRTSCC